MNNIILSISKGRIFKEGIIFLFYKKIFVKRNINSRKLFLKTNKKYIYILIIKNIDIKNFLRNNISDILIIGKDLILEEKKNFFNKNYNLNFSRCKLSILIKNFKKKKFKKLITKYKNLTKNFLKNKNIKIKILKLKSSIEIYLIIKITKLIIDIIASGKTIKINKILEIKNIIKLKAVEIFNNNLLKKKFEKIFFKINKKNWLN